MRYFTLLRRPAPLLLWIGQLTSTAGDRLYAMAVLWLTLELTGSTGMMATVSLFESVPYTLMGLIAGPLIDRWDRFRTMVAVDVLRAALVLLLPLAYLTGTLQPWHLMLTGMGLGVLEAFFSPALQASLPGLVEQDELPALSGLMDTTSRIARILGPGLVGGMLAFMPKVHFFSLDAATFVVSAVCLTLAGTIARRTAAPAKPRPRRSIRDELPVGWRLTRADAGIWLCLMVRGINNFLWAGFTLGAPLLAEQRWGGFGSYGLLIAAYGAGSLAGNLTAGNLHMRREHLVRWFMGGWVITGVGFFLLGLTASFGWALAATVVAGVGGPLAHIAMDPYIAWRIDPEDLGKVYSLQKIWINGALAVGTLTVGWGMEYIAPAGAVSVAGVLMAATAVAGLVIGGATSGRRSTLSIE